MLRPIATAALLGCALSFPLAAQDEPGDSLTIVVDGVRPLERADVIRKVEDGYARDLRREPVVRYHDPVCVQVNGLGFSANAEVAGHMRTAIRDLGIALAPLGCRANAVVVVSREPVAQLERIHRRTPKVLSAETLAAKRAAFERGHHAVVWHNLDVRGSDGDTIPMSGGIVGWTGPGGVTAPINNNGRPSRVRAGYARAANVGVVVYDANRLDEVELEQLANNALMRLLAPGFAIEVEPGSPETVLSGVEEGRGPLRLTRFDQALLEALYSMRPNERGASLGRAVGRAYEKGE